MAKSKEVVGVENGKFILGKILHNGNDFDDWIWMKTGKIQEIKKITCFQNKPKKKE